MKKVYAVFSLILGMVLASCGVGAASTTINVSMSDFQFVPNSFTVPAGREITVSATNNGAVIHNFVIMKLEADAGSTWSDEDVPNIYWEVELQPGGDVETSFVAPNEPGEYQVVCRTEGHIVSGMVANLTVVADE